MIRARRYRILLVLATILILTLIHFTRSREHPVPYDVIRAPPTANTKRFPFSLRPHVNANRRQQSPLSPQAPLVPPPPPPSHDLQSGPGLPQQSQEHPSTLDTASAESSAEEHSDAVPAESGKDKDYWPNVADTKHGSPAKGRLAVEGPESSWPAPHWKKPREHFPLPAEELIKLPSDQPRKLPKLQATFKDESSHDKMKRLQRLSQIKETFVHAWNGYKVAAMGHDEVTPVRGGSRDPFNGWGATLVDTLDTLWIMDLREEFAIAVDRVKLIDFTTCRRKDIPMFETVIRYLGGLLGAYDVSEHRYPVLLDKAKELAEVLIGAFDTPNRMPALFYNWAPNHTSKPHSADAKAVLAELGSLSVEFTRLAQLTKEDRYYDAIARITNELEKMQGSTKLPGLWPIKVDASGCKTATAKVPLDPNAESSTSNTGAKPLPSDLESYTNYFQSPDTAGTETLDSDDAVRLEGRALPAADADAGCKDGLRSPATEFDTFGMGSLADSAYEYLPKEHMLLGGLNPQYQTMYEKAMTAARKHLVFRPMAKGTTDVRFLASVSLSTAVPHAAPDQMIYKYEGTHLSCFAGGMVAIGAKLFGIDSDMDLARKLTDGCVWAYQATKSGIMPERFDLVPCKDPESCPWDETAYHRALDPYMEQRLARPPPSQKQQQQQQKQQKEGPKKPGSVGLRHSKRWHVVAQPKRRPTDTPNHKSSPDSSSSSSSSSSDSDSEPPSHQAYVSSRITSEHLPPGVTRITSRLYKLRPEAIESVFIMFRLTGDEYWRERGWKMFEAVSKITRTGIAHSAISDVTVTDPELLDEMESFWLAETLKYFYLLFCDPGVVSLDDYVLNTEAHPLKRPNSMSS